MSVRVAPSQPDEPDRHGHGPLDMAFNTFGTQIDHHNEQQER